MDELFAILKNRTSKSSDISKEDFISRLGDKIKDLSIEDLNDLFSEIDIDKSGSVSLAEI